MRIEISPEKGLADEPISVRLDGLTPKRTVRIKAQATDEEGQLWSSSASFRVDDSGELDLSRQGPSDGTYRGIDAGGLFWSMSPTDAKGSHPFAKRTPQPLRIRISAEVDGGDSASREIERLFLAPGVTRHSLEEHGLVGTFFLPETGKPRRGIIYLHGTVAEVREDIASLLASRGFPALALAYFDREGLPDELIEIPLEYVKKAILWISERDGVAEDGVSLFGVSRGGELALLSGSRFGEVKAVAAKVPSGVVFEGHHDDPRNREVRSAWTYEGRPVPFVPFKTGPVEVARFIINGARNKPVSTLPIYEKSMRDEEALRKAEIEVEEIGGPVLLFSGDQDQVWPSKKLSEIAIKRLESRECPHPYEHVCYRGAGHLFDLPYYPTTINYKTASSGTALKFGGTPRSSAEASIDCWSRALAFFEAAG